MNPNAGKFTRAPQPNDVHLWAVRATLVGVTANMFGIDFQINVHRDQKDVNGRIYIQVSFEAPCQKTGELSEWTGRKWYLSEHMTEDEVVKTAYAAFEAAVRHECMEGFKVEGVTLFNPHVNFRELLAISGREVKRI